MTEYELSFIENALTAAAGFIERCADREDGLNKLRLRSFLADLDEAIDIINETQYELIDTEIEVMTIAALAARPGASQ